MNVWLACGPVYRCVLRSCTLWTLMPDVLLVITFVCWLVVDSGGGVCVVYLSAVGRLQVAGVFLAEAE